MLIKQGPGKIGWTNWSFNPIAGCQHGCDYCYVNRIEKRFGRDMTTPIFRDKYLKDKMPKEPSKIFVGSSGDMWGDWVPAEWINRVLDVVENNPDHTFQFLTKNPKRYVEFELPKNGWYGTTDDGTDRTKDNIFELTNISYRTTFISFEPLLERVEFFDPLMDWIIIGANSNKGAKRPPIAWADSLIIHAQLFDIPVWVKDNYGYPLKTKEFPACE